MRYSVKTFGCKVNTYDSALIQKRLNKKGWTDTSVDKKAPPQVHVVNTCAVTETAVKEAQRWIRVYKRKNPETRILVTGCAAQVETKRFSDLKDVDYLIANSHKSELANILDEVSKKDSTQKVFKESIFKKSDLEFGGGLESQHSRLFLKIQDGCDSFCTFCIIPFARGKSRSLSPEQLIRSIQEHHTQGVQEVVLTGVHIGDYSMPNDPKKGLAELLEVLLKNTSIPRIRLSSLEPPELNEKLLELFSSPRVCPHFHMSLQSANSHILKKMKRQYTAQDIEKSLLLIHKNVQSSFVGMDIIAGFPGETQEQFEDTYTRLNNLPWTKMHVFPYSSRRFTYSDRFYQALPRSLTVKRAALLRHLSEDRFRNEQAKQCGSIKAVLPVKKESGNSGISRDYWKVEWSSTVPPSKTKKPSSNEILLRIMSVNNNGHLSGCVINES